MHDDIRSIIQSVITSRRSVRRYADRLIPREVLEQLLNAATWAPSAHNRQPWRFAVITTPDTRRKLAIAMGTRLRSDLTADHVPHDVIEKDVTRSFTRINSAPALIIACMSLADMDQYPDGRRASHEYTMAVQSTALAIQNLLLTAHAEGLGACWMCAPLFCPDTVCEELDLPSDWIPQALITLGYPAEERTSIRQPVESRVVWR